MEKEKINLKRLLIIVGIMILTAVITGSSVWYVMDKQAKGDKATFNQRVQDLQNQIKEAKNLSKSGITIATDKEKYQKGETIKIALNNKLDTPILYYEGGDRIWSIQYFQDNKWINYSAGKKGNFQLTEKNIGDSCSISLYERMPPPELKSGANISKQWSQKICPIANGQNPAVPSIVRHIESGQYRLSFAYGFHKSDNDPYKISDSETVYSNSFIIE